MKSKPFYLSKTFWSLLITLAITLWNSFIVQEYSLPPVPDWLLSILAMFGLYSRWTASGPLTLKRETPTIPENTVESSDKQVVTDDFSNIKKVDTVESSDKQVVTDDFSNIKKVDTQVKKAIINFTETNRLDNKSYYITHRLGRESDFLKLPESEQILDPEVFRKKYVPAPNASVDNKSVINTTSSEINSEKYSQKNSLLNKIYFLLEKCGTGKDFDALPDDIKNLPKDLFKEKTKNICPEKK